MEAVKIFSNTGNFNELNIEKCIFANNRDEGK